MTKRLGLFFSIVLVALLTVPTLAWLRNGETKSTLYGYVDKIPERPRDFAASFLDKKWQAWAERHVDVHFGFRTELIRTFNEVLFRVFREMPRLRLYSTPSTGLYSGMSLEYLNREIIQKADREATYAAMAAKLRKVQALLNAQGKEFVVVIAASKPYVYPEGLGSRYLAGGEEQVYQRAASLGRTLERAGVNVIDSARMLRAFRRQANLSTHPRSGVHWNYYAGCLVAEEIIERARARFAALQPFGCGIPRYEAPKDADIDGLNLMNIWTGGGLVEDTPYPSLLAREPGAWRPAITFISDSFSEEIITPLQQGQVYSKLVNSGYFRVRELDSSGAGRQLTHDVNAEVGATRRQVLDDIAASDIVVLQIVDYNLKAEGFDFPEYVLEHARGPGQSGMPGAAAPQPAPAPVAPVRLKTLALVDKGNWFNPIQIPSATHLVATPAQLLAEAGSNSWDVVAVLQKAGRRPPTLADDLGKRGYVIVASGEEGVLALPRRMAVPASADVRLEWTAYGEQKDATAALVGALPTVASPLPADLGLFTQELELDQPMLVRASFEGKIFGTEARAAHLSLHGIKPIFSLPQGSYTPDNAFFAIVPAQPRGTPVRFSFGLGGWAKGHGQLALKSLEFYPLAKLRPLAGPAVARETAKSPTGG